MRAQLEIVTTSIRSAALSQIATVANSKGGVTSELHFCRAAAGPALQQVWQLRDIRRNPSRLIARSLIFVKAQSDRFDILALAPRNFPPGVST
jgi:hypothetical protein